MARQVRILTALSVKNASKVGLYGDGSGLYLQVGPTGAKSWLFRFMMRGKARSMGLGPLHTISLAEARELALVCRKECLEGIDPIDDRLARNASTIGSSGPTFKDCAELYIAAHEAGWRNPKHVAQWRSTLEMYAGPIFGDKPIDQVDLGMVMQVLEPIWATKTETASRVRGRIESVLDWATVRGHRSGENPARWKGHLEALLPARSRVHKIKHHSALPFDQVPDFIKALRGHEAIAARAFEFLILTASRTGEVIGARWSEIDLEKMVWVIPQDRMKAGKEHRVPLTASTVSLLGARPTDGDTPLFVNQANGSRLSNMALLALLKRMNRTEMTAHGFRSSFRDWVAEKTEFPQELAEMALAHTISNKVEAAYRRGDMFEKRRELARAWADFCSKG